MSYRLIDSNAIAIKYPEVNEMPCVFANLPDGMNGQFIDAQPEQKTGYWIQYVKRFPWSKDYKCSECGNYINLSGINCGRGDANYCPNCGAKMEGDLT